MILSKTVETTWSTTNKSHYVSLGYKFTSMKQPIKVKIKDLMVNSRVEVSIACDICGTRTTREFGDIHDNCICKPCAKLHSAYSGGIYASLKNRKDNGASYVDLVGTKNQKIVDYSLNQMVKKNTISKHKQHRHYFLVDKSIQRDTVKNNPKGIDCCAKHTCGHHKMVDNLMLKAYTYFGDMLKGKGII